MLTLLFEICEAFVLTADVREVRFVELLAPEEILLMLTLLFEI